MNSFLMLLCTTSIFSLVAVSVDRFWAIIYPLNYPVVMTRTKAMLIIMFCWMLAAIIGLLPSMGWNKGPPNEPRCFFLEVMDLRYLAFINFATIVAPTVFMAVVYTVIYRAVQGQVIIHLITPSIQTNSYCVGYNPSKCQLIIHGLILCGTSK
jgi:hypothetical protein